MSISRFSKSSNPVMNDDTYRNAAGRILDSELVASNVERMTTTGAINKTFVLTGLLLLTSVFSYSAGNPVLMWVGAIGGLIAVVAASFKQEWSPYLAPVYAVLEGLFVGTISAMYANLYDGIIFQAVSLTIALLFMMLFLYKMEVIKVTEKFRSGVIMATGAVLLVYVLDFILGFFGINVPYLHQGGAIGIGISVVIIGIASLNLLLDFDYFEKGEQYGAPKYMEWYSAMGLLVTLVWLYLEILRLLSMLSSRD